MRPLVVIPTYNESENIERMLRRIHECLPGAGVLVVDDGSPDGTAEIVKKVAAELSDINVLERSSKSGLGSAYRAGFAWGLERGYDACIEIDADFSHDPAALPTLVAPLGEGFDVVIGSRYVEGGSIPNWAWHRHLLSRGGNLYASGVLGLGVSDSTAGYRCYSAGILRRLELDKIRAEGYGFQIEMTYRARQYGAVITEVPIKFVDREAGESKMSSFIVVEALGLVTFWGVAGTGAEALEQVRTFRPHLVMLDVMLPDFDGNEVCRRLRNQGEQMPIVFLTARDTTEDKVEGLSMGDDYVTKPFSIEELMARVGAILRRAGEMAAADTSILRFADLMMNIDTHEVWRDELSIDLTATEFNLLRYLLENARRVISKSELLDNVWGYDFHGDPNIVETYISYLRKKIDDREPALIHTIRRVGYTLRLPRDG
jgi:dolichol-phosphate mannosyltransferase